MKVFNTLTNQLENFYSLEENEVRMYVCGPTVYNYIHIGNARPVIVFDAVRRYFEYKGYKVNFVQNFTDIDDKIIKTSIEQGVPAVSISEKYIEEFFKDADGLNVKRATNYPKVTEEIPSIIEMIGTLIEKGYAYENNGTVYYETNKFETYGKLSNKKQEDLEAGARIAINEDKKNPMDFVLWKPKKPGEPAWQSPWGEGRPGWHIECSVMAKKYLGDSIDIHAGGEDLVFPHHENEIAQSEAANGQSFAKYWLHNRFLNIDNRKMSKSQGNFFTVREVSEAFSYEVLRFFMLNAHYRSPINFSRDLMESAATSLERIKTGVENLDYLSKESQTQSMTAKELKLVPELDQYRIKFEEAMNDDFNTADAIAVIFELIRFSNTLSKDGMSRELAVEIKELIKMLANVLGINVEKAEVLLEEDIEKLIQERQDARKNRDFKRADEIRDELKSKGIVLEDTREGVRWKKETV